MSPLKQLLAESNEEDSPPENVFIADKVTLGEAHIPFSHRGPWCAALQKQLPVSGSQPVECSRTQSHSLEQPAPWVHLGQAEEWSRTQCSVYNYNTKIKLILMATFVY